MPPRKITRSFRREKIIAAGAGLPPGIISRAMGLLAAAVASPFPPSITDPRILLSDWSMYQEEIEIGKHLAYGPPKFRGAIIRSGQGRYSEYDDPKFIPNVHKCVANDFPWMVYHVLLPNQNVPEQVGNLYTILNRLGGILPRWIWWDVEVKNNQTKRQISNATILAVDLTKHEIDIETGVYSAKWFTDGFMETQDWFSEIVWWIAQWLWPNQQREHPWPTALPATVDISQVMIHQTTSFGDGRLVGMGSRRVDLDRWMWTLAQFNKIMGIDGPQPNLEEQVKANTAAIVELREWASNIALK